MSLLAFAVAAAVAAAVPASAPASGPPAALSVRVYDLYGLAATERAAAMRIAVETMKDAGVTVRWIDCSRADGQLPAGCVTLLGEGDIVLRIQDRTERGGHILGSAVVRDQGVGVLASAFAGAIADRSVKSGVPRATILGRVVAHEIGHLLLGSNSHGPHGLMRASWNVKWPHPADWKFSRQDAAAIRSRLRPGYEGDVAAFVSAAAGGAR
jgi:hypothetical protein